MIDDKKEKPVNDPVEPLNEPTGPGGDDQGEDDQDPGNVPSPGKTPA